MNEEIDAYVAEHAPELDPRDVRDFMARNEKPVSEPGTPIEWATRLLRRRRADAQPDEGPALDLVTEEMRRHDERQQP